MPIVERYILRRTSAAFLVTLFWTLAAVWTTQVVARINLVTDSGQSALAFLQLATMILPSVIPVVIPFAVAIAVSQALGAMNADSELAVVNAAGSSRLSVVRPILILGILSSLFSFAIDNGVEPAARQKAREMVSSARADLISTVIQEGSFRKIEEGLFIQVGQRLPDGRLGGIFVADARQPNIDLIYHAKTGVVLTGADMSALVMSDGVVHRKSPDGDVSVIRFKSYAFDLAAFSPGKRQRALLPKDQTLAYLFNPDPEDKHFQDRPQRFRAEIHIRMTEWLYPLVFALIALAVAGDARSFREARVHPIVTTLVAALFVRWLGYVAGNETHENESATAFVYAVPLIACAVPAYFILTNRSMEIPSSWAEQAGSLYGRWSDRMVEWRFALKGFRRPLARRQA